MKTLSCKSFLFKAVFLNSLLFIGFSCTPDIGLNKSLNIQMVSIPAGKFMMGYPGNEHKDSTQGFWMSKYEITNEQFAEFLNTKQVNANGLYKISDSSEQKLIEASSQGLVFKNDAWKPDSIIYASNPVVFVTWYGANEFAKYKGGRLPTQTEWEYACRGGTTTLFNLGDLLPNNLANYDWSKPYVGDINIGKEASKGTTKVGLYPPNAYGLYDMHGNVWEWCTSLEDLASPTSRIAIRGGGWNSEAFSCRSGNLQYFDSNGISLAWPIGFRIVISY